MYHRVLLLLIACCLSLSAWGATEVRDMRLWAAPDRTRVVFDITQPVDHRIFELSNPRRVVVDLSNARLNTSLPDSPDRDGLIRQIRSGTRHGVDLRVVFDLAAEARPRAFLLPPKGPYGHRLVIDLEAESSSASRSPRPDKRSPRSRPGAGQLVVAVDAGHGGEDPGAVGRAGTREKDVVLRIARRLAAMIDSHPGMRAVLIRDGDYYLGLRERIVKARRHKANLFISIHADAFKHSSARGSSVYVLSERGASDEAARWLAERENAADLIGGVSLEGRDEVLASVLLDLSQTATIDASLDLGAQVLRELTGVGQVHKGTVQQAGFLVLKSPDIPSVLVETAFISNPHEERRLRDPAHQRRLAGAIFEGVRQYAAARMPEVLFAEGGGYREHRIRRGETLSYIASRYDVSVSRLRELNGLEDDMIRAGAVLKIPAAFAEG